MDWACGLEDRYGGLGNAAEVLHMEKLDFDGKKAHIKKLWKENPETYYAWKKWCVARNRLPDFFGTRDNPILIDESKL